MADTIAGFETTEFTHDGVTKQVFRAGSGPGILVMTEMPGITPRVTEFAQRLVSAGYTVALPDLFGTPGREPGIGYTLGSITRACVSREFTTWALDRTSPVIDWLRAVGRDLHARCGGPGIGAIGMCFTGGFALALAVDEHLLAPVLSQPSLPFGIGASRKRALGTSDADVAIVAAREDLCLLAMRFTGDKMVPDARFEHLREVFGDRLIAVEIDSHTQPHPHGIPKTAHSVVTEHLVDEEGHPTRVALDRVMAFFAERLTA